MWVRHTMRNVGPPQLGFSFPVGPPSSFLINRSFQSYQNPDNFKSWRSLFHHLWVRHTVNYIIPPHVWVRHTVRNVSPPEDFSFRWVRHLPSSVTVAFRASKIPTSLRVDVFVAIRTTKTLEGTMLPVNYRSWQRSFSELPKTCQQWDLTFLSNVAFWAAKIPTTFRADFPEAFRATLSLEGTMLPVNCQSWQL